MQKELVQVKATPGAHVITDVRETQSGIWVDVQLIGGGQYSARMEDVTPYDASQPAAEGNQLFQLAQRAVIKYSLDPMRVQKAHDLASREGWIIPRDGSLMVKSQSFDDYNFQSVKNPKGKIYSVSQSSCTCKDTERGNICKHRIAAWMYREMHPEYKSVRIFVHEYCFECGTAHWIETRGGIEICHGEKFDPRNIPQTYFKTRNFTSARRPAEIEVFAKGV